MRSNHLVRPVSICLLANILGACQPSERDKPLIDEASSPPAAESLDSTSAGGRQSSTPLASDLSTSDCYSVELSEDLLWASSGVWSNQTLLVVDTLKERVNKITPDGSVTPFLRSGQLFDPNPSSSSLMKPWYVRAGADETFLLEDEKNSPKQEDEIFQFDTSLNVISRLRIKGRVMGENGTLAAIYDWSPTQDGIMAFGDINGPGENEWHSGFIYFSNSRQQVFKLLAAESKWQNLFYVSTYSYITTIGNEGYGLLFGERASIAKMTVGSEIEELPSFPKDFLRSDKFEIKQAFGAEMATMFYRALESARIPTGLFSQDNALYLLAKEAATPNITTTWFLIKIDRNSGSEEWRLQLPTDAPHLLVIPGSSYWSLIEKGPVEAVGPSNAPYMQTASMVLMPSEWLNKPPPSLKHGLSCIRLAR